MSIVADDRIRVVHHPDYVAANNPESRYRWNKNGLVRDLLAAEGARIAWIEPAPMPLRWIEAVHDPAYVAEVVNARVPKEKERRIGFPVTPSVARRAVRVPGGTYAAARAALSHGFAVNSAGGSHHALADSGAGYCVFNDLAIAAVRLVEEAQAARVLIVDCDVHQGDGTARLTAARPAIATYSIHAERNFPARKATSTVDVPLADGTGDAAYLAALEATLVPLLDRFAPSLILYQGGVDPFAGDRLGRLALSAEGLDARDRLVAGLAGGRGLPFAGTLGGGYGDDIMAVAERHVRSVLVLAAAYAAAARRSVAS
ncbi:histone deacetylase [Sphingomonas profundi]|uniref:histone deacetylase family protein n=1 Tax=Alterirhizorhabdus profundi TaxID=2681549 RepID=UPI0012E9805E|nr:histone deacetylase [Sphingomonas profundi]